MITAPKGGGRVRKMPIYKILTSLPERLVVEPRLANLIRVPVIPDELLVDVDDVQMLIHPQFMHITAHQHGPVLGWVRALMDLLGDHLTQPGLLGEPLASRPRDRMPAQLHGAGLAADVDLAGGHDVGPLAEPQLMLDSELCLEHVVFPSPCVRFDDS